MYTPYYAKSFKRSLKKLEKSGNLKRSKIEFVIDALSKGESLSIQYKDHPLRGDWLGYRECHIESDLLLIYTIQEDVLILLLADMGSHSELFG
jgi:mRNA interferase YafQ